MVIARAEIGIRFAVNTVILFSLLWFCCSRLIKLKEKGFFVAIISLLLVGVLCTYTNIVLGVMKYKKGCSTGTNTESK